MGLPGDSRGIRVRRNQHQPKLPGVPDRDAWDVISRLAAWSAALGI